MTYSKYFFPQKAKIPFPLTVGLLLLILILLARTFSSNPILTKASKKNIKSLTIFNLTHNQVGIFWQTDKAETGWLNFGENENNLTKSALDERDLQEKRSQYRNHYAILKNLKPNTRYFYKILSNNQAVQANNRRAFSFQTPPILSTTTGLDPAYGKIIEENGNAVENAIVIINIKNAYPLATLSKTTGEWLIPINYIVQ